MHNSTVSAESIIHGRCSLFVCRTCRTKYGWEHQKWCGLYTITKPSCKECRYYREQNGECIHPAKKDKEGDTCV